MATLSKVYKIEIDGKQANASVSQLKTEIKNLEAALENVALGSAEADEAVRRLGTAKGALKELDDAVDALDPKNKAAAFADFANGVVGAFSVATTAATAFGLSSATADEYREKLDSLLVTMSGVEQISRALNSETLSVVKSTFAAAKGWLGVGEAATTSGKMTRAALATTGIGLLVVALATLYANWDKVTAYVKRNKEAVVDALRVISPPLSFVVDQVGAFADKVGGLPQLFSGLAEVALSRLRILGDAFGSLFEGDFEGLKQRAAELGQGIGEAFNKGVTDKNVEIAREAGEDALKITIEANKRLLAEQEAAGRDTYALKRTILQQELSLLKQESEEEKKVYADKLSEIRVLDIQHQKKLADDREAARKKAAEKEKERLKAARAAERAALEEQQAFEVSLRSAAGKDTLELRIKQAEALLAQDKERSAEELAQMEKDLRALYVLQAEYNQREKELEDNAQQARKEARQDEQAQALEDRARFNAGVLEGANAALDQAKALAQRAPDLGRDLLEKVFGVDPEKSAALKAALTQIAGELYTALEGLAGSFLSAALEEADRQLEEAQARYEEADRRLSEAQSRREEKENALKTATGARRDYLIQQISKERQEEQKLAAEKTKAAAEQAKAEKEKHRLEKISQQLSAASAAATAVATAVSAGYAAVKAVEKGSEVPFPVNLIAIGTGLAAVISAVAAAKNLRNSMKYRDGGVMASGVLVGPSHERGGIQLWGRNGVHYGEAEGGEGVLPVDATRNNRAAFELLRTQGRTRTLTPLDFATIANNTQVLPPPAPVVQGRYAEGGIVAPTGRTAAPGGITSPESVRVLEAKLDRNNALLEMIVSATSTTAATNQQLASYGPPRLAIGPEQALAIEQQKQQAQQKEKGVRLI